MKKISMLLSVLLCVALLAGCAGTPVIYQTNCTCPTGEAQSPAGTTPAPTAPAESNPVAEGAVKTGLAILASAGESTSASAEAEGEAKYDVTVVAVTVDDAGVIQSCIIDSIGTSVKFDAAGVVTTDLTAAIATKNELGEGYGMKAYAGSQYEWNEQAAALASYAVGKTVEELKSGAVGEDGKAKDADLATTATIYLGGYVAGIEKAAANAQHLGAQAGDTLKLAVMPSVSGSKNADGENAGLAQLDVDVTALTMNGEIITSCTLDALQAKVSFDAAGQLTTDLTAPMQTKNELGEAYGMKLYAGSAYEWNEQAAAFAAYATGKTVADIAGMAVSDGKPTDADIAATVTIAVGGFQALIAKAAQ